MVRVCERLGHYRNVPAIRLDEPIVRMRVKTFRGPAILRVIVNADYLVSALEQRIHDVATDESGRAGHTHDCHHELPFREARSVMAATSRRLPNANKYHF